MQDRDQIIWSDPALGTSLRPYNLALYSGHHGLLQGHLLHVRTVTQGRTSASTLALPYLVDAYSSLKTASLSLSPRRGRAPIVLSIASELVAFTTIVLNTLLYVALQVVGAPHILSECLFLKCLFFRA